MLNDVYAPGVLIIGARGRSRQICLEQIWTDAVRPQGENQGWFSSAARRVPVRSVNQAVQTGVQKLFGARGRSRTGTPVKARDFRTTTAFAAVRSLKTQLWSGLSLHHIAGILHYDLGGGHQVSTLSLENLC